MPIGTNRIARFHTFNFLFFFSDPGVIVPVKIPNVFKNYSYLIYFCVTKTKKINLNNYSKNININIH